MSNLTLELRQRGALAMTPALRQAIGFQALSNAELSARLADLAGPLVQLAPAAAQEGAWLTLSRQIGPPTEGRPPPPRGPAPSLGGMDAGRIAEAAPGLVAHVEAQLPLLVRDPADRPVARALLAALEPSGWLGLGLDEIAAEAGCAPARAERVLRLMQAAEPAGLFARSLAECLELQAEDRGLMTPAFRGLLQNLPLLAKGDRRALAEACRCSDGELEEMVHALRRMNPKPGADFAQGPVARAAAPAADLVLRRDGAGWLVELNAETAPVLRLQAGPEAAPDALRQARALVQALDRRHATALEIAAVVVARQDAHLRDAAAPLAALTINDLARETGLHRSTVSRVTAALSLALRDRRLGLRDLMSAAAPPARRLEEPVSVQAVLQRMRQIVADEDPGRPLSDAALAELLLPEGAALARRTVAKYRGLAGIASRAARRRA